MKVEDFVAVLSAVRDDACRRRDVYQHLVDSIDAVRALPPWADVSPPLIAPPRPLTPPPEDQAVSRSRPPVGAGARIASDHERLVLDALANGPLSARDLKAATGIKPSMMAYLLTQMAAHAWIRKTGTYNTAQYHRAPVRSTT